MKLIIRDYLASLKERGELDAILPDLLSELGFTVYSRPRRGTAQHGVDVAAVGEDQDGVRKVFLFTLKQGDLTRQDWDGPPQSLRPSLNEIKDAYIPTRIPRQYKDLKIVICLCFGGEVQEQVRAALTGYIEQNSTNCISFAEWSGDKLAGLLLQGILREEILPKNLRSSFQKAVAMVDEPDIAYRHFADLVQRLRERGDASQKACVTAARQIYLCLWIMFVWARDIDNVDAPYRASELALLSVWHLLRPFIGKKTKHAKAVTTVFHQLIQLHVTIAAELLERKVLPHVGTPDALSMAVDTRSSVDVNLKLFDLLGRLAMMGLWLHWFVSFDGDKPDPAKQEKVGEWSANAFKLVEANTTLFSPLCDQHAIEVALVLLLATVSGSNQRKVFEWLQEMANRLHFTVRSHGRYPCVFTEYRDLVDHPRERTDEYRKEATSGSIIIPLLAAWLTAMGANETIAQLAELQQSDLEHCTMQVWLPDSASEEAMYIGGRGHGVAICDLRIAATGDGLLATIAEACQKETGFAALSANKTGYWPIVLLACRHFRHPIPAHFWIRALYSAGAADSQSAA